jgi:hypothetical protein
MRDIYAILKLVNYFSVCVHSHKNKKFFRLKMPLDGRTKK